MKYLLPILLLGLCFRGFGQSEFARTYYPAVNQAEMAITKEDYSSAYHFYKTAFAAVKSPFARDLFNALVCKILLNDFEGAKPLLIKLSQKGISPATLEQKEIFRRLEKRNEWESFKAVCQQIWESRSQDESSELVREWHKSVKADLDSAFVNSERVVEDHFSITTYKRGKVVKVVPKIDTAGVKKDSLWIRYPQYNTSRFVNIQSEVDSVESKYRKQIEEYLISHPWPGEDQLGISEDDLSFSSTLFTSLVGNQNKTYHFSFSDKSLTLYSVKGKNSHHMSSQIIKAVNEGRLHPIQASLFIMGSPPRLIEIFKATIENTSDCALVPEINGKIDKWLLKRRSITPQDENFFRYIRENFHMPSKDDMFEKYKYQAIRNKYFIFPQQIHREETTLPSCESAVGLLREAVIMDEH